MKRLLMHPPKWLEKILSKFPCYREWYIKEVMHTVQEDLVKALYEDLREEEDE